MEQFSKSCGPKRRFSRAKATCIILVKLTLGMKFDICSKTWHSSDLIFRSNSHFKCLVIFYFWSFLYSIFHLASQIRFNNNSETFKKKLYHVLGGRPMLISEIFKTLTSLCKRIPRCFQARLRFKFNFGSVDMIFKSWSKLVLSEIFIYFKLFIYISETLWTNIMIDNYFLKHFLT